jgi:hypothetical protein
MVLPMLIWLPFRSLAVVARGTVVKDVTVCDTKQTTTKLRNGLLDNLERRRTDEKR